MGILFLSSSPIQLNLTKPWCGDLWLYLYPHIFRAPSSYSSLILVFESIDLMCNSCIVLRVALSPSHTLWTILYSLRMAIFYPSAWNYNLGFRLSGTQDKNLITYTSKLAGVTEAWTRFFGRRPSFDAQYPSFGFEIGCLVTVVQISWEIHLKFRRCLACGPAVKACSKSYGSTIIVAKRVTGLFWLLLNVANTSVTKIIFQSSTAPDIEMVGKISQGLASNRWLIISIIRRFYQSLITYVTQEEDEV